jgi:D-alanyl-D-alanine carboxypeptidase
MRGFRAAAALLVAATLLWADAAAARQAPPAPRITARAFVAIDAASGRVLVERRARARLPIASLTKVMTALLVIERGRLHEKVSVPQVATLVEPSKDDLVAGRRYRRLTLLWSALLASANDSAVALAWDAGGGSLQRFYDLMNARARELGLASTTYASASGLEDRRNLSTALDQALLARAALRNPLFARIVATERRVTRWAAPTVAKEWVNHNRMLTTYPGTYGVKTGWTTRAGGCLAVAVRRDGRDVIAVVLGSKGIWHDMPLVLERAFRSAGAAAAAGGRG